MRGTIKTFNRERGYGFIKLAGGADDVFFHISVWPSDLDPVRDQQVEFDIVTDPKSGGPRASNLRLV